VNFRGSVSRLSPELGENQGERQRRESNRLVRETLPLLEADRIPPDEMGDIAQFSSM
jgi:hypothetical protein